MASLMHVTFRPLERADLPLVARWLAEPHVAKWWMEPSDLDAVEAKYGPRVHGPTTTEMFVIQADGTSVGLIQRYRHGDHPAWDRTVGVERAAGIDYLVGEPDRIGSGIGSAA